MLELNDVHKTFFSGKANEVRALRGVNLVIEQGSWISVIGANGSGKSTLLNAVAGAFPIDTGEIQLDGTLLNRWSEHRRAKLIGRVFQDPTQGTAPSLTIAENLALAVKRGQRRGLLPALLPSSKQVLRDRIADLQLGLEDRLDSPMGTLSGGQRQSLTLLMAVLIRPALLLLDEHTAALDPKSANQVINLTQRFIEEQSLTVLMVTHSMYQATRLGNRIIMMERGQIVQDISGEAKKRLKPAELLAQFGEMELAN